MKLSKVAKLFRSILPGAQPDASVASKKPSSLHVCQISERTDLIPSRKIQVYEFDGVSYLRVIHVLGSNPTRFTHPIFTNYTADECKRLANYFGRPDCIFKVCGERSRATYIMSVDDFIEFFELERTEARGKEFIERFTGRTYLAATNSRKKLDKADAHAPEPADAKVTVFGDVEVPQHIYEAMVSSRVGQVFSELMEIAQSLGLRGHEAAIYADNGVQKHCGFSVLEAMGMRGAVRPEDDRRSYTPTELGATMDLSAVGFNKLLERYGLQVRIRNKWQPTELGLPHCAVFDHYVSESETPSNRLQVKWFKSVLTELARCLDKEDGSLEDAA